MIIYDIGVRSDIIMSESVIDLMVRFLDPGDTLILIKLIELINW